MTARTHAPGVAVATVLAALDRAGCRSYTRGTGTRAQCPAHGSRGLTLSLRQGDRGAMLTCFAGCELDDLLAALDLTRRDLFDTDLPAGYTPPPRRQPTTWDPVTSGPGVDHLLRRIDQQARIEATADYWQRRAAEAEAAMTRPTDYAGRPKPAHAMTHDQRCVALAAACRRRAASAARTGATS